MRSNHQNITFALGNVLLKIPRLMNDFIYKYDLFTMNMMGMGENPEIYRKTKEKSPVWLPSHPPVYRIGGILFSEAKEPETSRTCPRWDRNPNL